MRSLHPWPTFPPNLEPPTARSFSLLFILQEWISCCTFLENLKKVSPISFSLTVDLEKFLVISFSNPFPQKGGFLDKLCFYSDILLQASKINDETLLMILEEMRNTILLLRSKLIGSQKTPVSSDQLEKHAKETFQILAQKLHAFFYGLIPYLQEARTDENVLIYLLEKKQMLNRFLGDRSIEKMLKKFFPAGQPQLRAVICEGFTRRGFTSFLAEKESLIEELEWETPCHPPSMPL